VGGAKAKPVSISARL
jgi:hypothetical protein